MSTAYFTTQTTVRSAATNSFTATNFLWKTDGTAAGTQLVFQSGIHTFDAGETSFPITDVVVDGSRVFFADGTQFYVSDGTAAGTHQVARNFVGDAFGSGGSVYFGGSAAPTNFGLYRTSGADATAVDPVIFGAGGEKSLTDFVANGSKEFFIANFFGIDITGHRNGVYNGQLWVTDGTAAGTIELKAQSASNNYVPESLASMGGQVYFGVNNGTFANAAQLWKTDGTSAGTVLVKDLSTSNDTDQSPTHITAINNKIFFTGSDGTHGVELWVSDGTTAGTVVVRDINPGTAGSGPGNFTNVGGTLYFTATDPVHGTELWKSNGTEAGTRLVDDIHAGSASGSISSLTEANGILYFSANDGSGAKLWRSDGSTLGTFAIFNAAPTNLTNVNGTLYFEANNNLMQTDGSAAGTTVIGGGTNALSINAALTAPVNISPDTSSIPALLIEGLVNGQLPSADRLDFLQAFAQGQYKYYNDVLHSSVAQLGPYEALGRAFAALPAFQNKFAGGTDIVFVQKAYDDVFHHAPSTVQQNAFLAQVSFYENLFQQNGISATESVNQARGAIYGQMAGIAAVDPSQPYQSYLANVIADINRGVTTHYGEIFGL